jgi:hypothetical protein
MTATQVKQTKYIIQIFTGYHILVFIMVFACLTVTVFSTIEEFEDMAWIFMVELQKIMQEFSSK